MKQFYTERDIEEMVQAGVTELEINDDVVVTDVAREKATALGLRLKPVQKKTTTSDTPTPASSIDRAKGVDPELVSRIKSTVIARLGTAESAELLDRIIPQVLARLGS